MLSALEYAQIKIADSSIPNLKTLIYDFKETIFCALAAQFNCHELSRQTCPTGAEHISSEQTNKQTVSP